MLWFCLVELILDFDVNLIKIDENLIREEYTVRGSNRALLPLVAGLI